MRLLAKVLERRGKAAEAKRWRRKADKFTDEPAISYLQLDPGQVVTVAVVSVAVATFVKAIVTKAGEDSYAAARSMVKWLFRRGRPKASGLRPRERLLVVEDPDPKLMLAISITADTPDEQLRALEHLDLEAEIERAKRRKAHGLSIEWDEVSKSWKVRER